jgi:hypothetical protein
MKLRALECFFSNSKLMVKVRHRPNLFYFSGKGSFLYNLYL